MITEWNWPSRLQSHSSRSFHGVTVNLSCYIQFSLSPVHVLPEFIKHFLPGLFINFTAKPVFCLFACIRGAPWSHCSWLFCHKLTIFLALAYVCFSLHPQLFLLVLLPLWWICDFGFMCFFGSPCLIQISDSIFNSCIKNCCKNKKKKELIIGSSYPHIGKLWYQPTQNLSNLSVDLWTKMVGIFQVSLFHKLFGVITDESINCAKYILLLFFKNVAHGHD